MVRNNLAHLGIVVDAEYGDPSPTISTHSGSRRKMWGTRHSAVAGRPSASLYFFFGLRGKQGLDSWLNACEMVLTANT